MTKNQLQFMLLTGKYLPDEDIKLEGLNYKYEIFDEYNRRLYYETSYGYWEKREFDLNGNCTYFESSKGYWCKQKYNENNLCTYYDNSKGYWFKKDNLGNLIGTGKPQ